MLEKELQPCDLGQIAASGQCFRMTEDGAGGWRVCAVDRCVYMEQHGSRFSLDCSEREFEEFWKSYFDWETDYKVFLEAVDAEDGFLQQAIRFGGGLRILRQDLWETLITFVISQNNNIPRIRASVEALCQAWGEKRLDSRGQPYFTFPTKQQLSCATTAELRSMGLGYRDRYIEAIAHSDFDAEAVRKLDMEQAHAALTALPGVGKKVAHCVQLFGLHDLAAFPVDTWIRKMCEQHYHGRFPMERYTGFAGVIQQYMFFYGRTQDGKS